MRVEGPSLGGQTALSPPMVLVTVLWIIAAILCVALRAYGITHGSPPGSRTP